MPQPFPQPRHPDDTPDAPTRIPDILREEHTGDGHTSRFRLDSARDHTTSPLRRALERARHHLLNRSKEN